MIPALVAGALAALLWPDPGAVRRARLAATAAGRENAPDHVRRLPPGLPVAPTVGLAAAALTATVSTALVAALAGAATFLVVRARLVRQGEVRAEARLAALTEGLAALAAELRSGRSLEAATAAAVAACADEDSGPRLASAVRAPAARGRGSTDDVLSAALDRISAAVHLSTRTGCSLAAVAGAVEDDLRARARHRQELRSVTAGPRASAVVLAGLPVLGLAMGSGVGADPWRVLTTTGTGQLLLVVGVTLELAGLAWTGHLVRRAVR